MSLIATSAPAYALSLAILLALVYLFVVRLMDLNEKEPLWSLASVFVLGALSALLVWLFVGSETLELDFLWGPFFRELAKFAALAAAVGVFMAIASWRGWFEISGLMDGIVYGATAGLGFATGIAFVRELTFGPGLTSELVGAWGVLWTSALAGLAEGLFGAIVGAGYGAAVQAHSSLQRIAYPILGLIGAWLAHALYTWFARGNALAGTEGFVRAWIALLLPLLFVIGVAVYALQQERRAIREELAEEVDGGTVTREELGLLSSLPARRGRYAKAFMRGDFDGWLALRGLHNRQVELAMAKRRVSREASSGRRAQSEAEVEALRRSVGEMRSEAERAWGPVRARQEAAR